MSPSHLLSGSFRPDVLEDALPALAGLQSEIDDDDHSQSVNQVLERIGLRTRHILTGDTWWSCDSSRQNQLVKHARSQAVAMERLRVAVLSGVWKRSIYSTIKKSGQQSRTAKQQNRPKFHHRTKRKQTTSI